MKKIRIGVMGCASIAERSMIPAIKSLSDKFQLIAVASRNVEKAQTLAAKFNCEGICGYDALLDRKDIDAVYIPLPTGLHYEWVMKSLNADKHVYVEKSSSLSYSDSKAFVDVARSRQLVLMEGYMFLYHSQQKKILELIDSGIIGEIRHFSASFGFPPLSLTNFRYDKQVGGGAIMDCAGYVVRATSLILRQRLNVQAASIHYDKAGVSLYGSAFLVGDENIPACVSFGFDNFYQCKYEVWGSKGKLIASKAFTPKEKESPILLLETSEGLKQIVCDADNHFKKSMAEFADSISMEHYELHYREILEQSFLLDEILKYSVR